MHETALFFLYCFTNLGTIKIEDMFIKILLLSIGLVALAFIGFGINILFKKNGRFPEGSVGKNKALRERKIYCMKTEQKLIDQQIKAENDSICSC